MGNVRLSYSDLDKSGDIDKETEIIEENNYYPFGLKHRGYNEIVNAVTEHKSRFNDTEFDADFDLNWYNMPLRHQDPTTGRWNGIDPVTHFSSSTYASHNNNPVFWADPSGADGVIYLILAGGFDRATAEKIATHTMAIFQHFDLDIKVTVLNSAAGLPKLDATDNWAVIGNDRNAIVDEAAKIGAHWVKTKVRTDTDSDYSNIVGWENYPSLAGQTELANNNGNGMVISHTDNLKIQAVKPFLSDEVFKGINGRNLTYIEGSALTLAHAAGHDAKKVDEYGNETTMGHLISGMMAAGEALAKQFADYGLGGESITNRFGPVFSIDRSRSPYAQINEPNNAYADGMFRRYTPNGTPRHLIRAAKLGYFGLKTILSSATKASPVSIGPFTRMYSSWW